MVQSTNKLRICLAASAGGHLSQLLRIKDGWNSNDSFCLTTSDTVLETLQEYGKVYVVGECNRQHPVRVTRVFLRCLKIVFREKPHVVISTGAAVGCIVCFLAKLIGAKVVWIESITNVERLSLSGRMVRYIADLFLVQWAHLADWYKSAVYIGSVI